VRISEAGIQFIFESGTIPDSALRAIEVAIEKNVKVYLNQNQFDALAHFAVDFGIEELRQEKNSFIRLLNAGRYNEVAHIDPQGKIEGLILEWCHTTGTFSPNLLRRREAEARIWCTPYQAKHQANDNARQSYIEEEVTITI
jgi:GH24 family phage-related lysozyme (muramidase)